MDKKDFLGKRHLALQRWLDFGDPVPLRNLLAKCDPNSIQEACAWMDPEDLIPLLEHMDQPKRNAFLALLDNRVFRQLRESARRWRFLNRVVPDRDNLRRRKVRELIQHGPALALARIRDWEKILRKDSWHAEAE